MERLTALKEKLSKEMDKFAGYCVVGIMLLVVSNIILRKAFKISIVGTYEIVGYLTALAISFALAYCAVKKAHIGVDYIIGKFPKPIQKITGIVISLASAAFWGLTALQVGRYAISLKQSGVVSSTAQIPMYPIVFLIAIGLLALGFVSAVEFFESINIVPAEKKIKIFTPESILIAEVKEAK